MEGPSEPGPLALVGYMGSGKSVVGNMVARKLCWRLVDLDREVSLRAGRSIPEIFAERGETGFRSLESEVLRAALEKGGGKSQRRVVACGGGAVVREENRAILAQVATVFLREDVEVLYRRTRDGDRPLRGAGREEFERRYRKRMPYYEAVADLTVEVKGRPAEEISEEVARWWSRSGARRSV